MSVPKQSIVANNYAKQVANNFRNISKSIESHERKLSDIKNHSSQYWKGYGGEKFLQTFSSVKKVLNSSSFLMKNLAKDIDEASTLVLNEAKKELGK